MKKTLNKSLFMGLAFASFVCITSCNSKKDTTEKVVSNYDEQTVPPSQLCVSSPNWFPHSQTPAPEEGKGSPFDVESTTNQIFHQWSWQKFLWLTKPSDSGIPIFLDKSQVLQVTSKMENIPSSNSGALVILTDTKQAGKYEGVLQTNPEFSPALKEQTVYYSIHMNHVMYDTALVLAQQIIDNKEPDMQNVTFPVGSFELKAAWVSIDAIPNNLLNNYFITLAEFPATPKKKVEVKRVALIGLHIVGVVENHPEFIWATFQHDDLAPVFDWKNKKAESDQHQLLFMKGIAKDLLGIQYDTASKTAVNPYHIFDLYKYGVPLTEDGNFIKSSQNELVNFDNIDGINLCVKRNLDDVWSNYFYNGSIWLDMDNLPTTKQQAERINSYGGSVGRVDSNIYLRGSLNCANITMESYTQTYEKTYTTIQPKNLLNCMFCHSSKGFLPAGVQYSPLYFSHIFQDYILFRSGKTDLEIENIKLANERRIFMLLNNR